MRAITDGNGNVVQTLATDAFGNPANPPGSQGTLAQPFGYTGEPIDPLGLVDLRARVYSPVLGRFLQRDPLSGSILSPQTLNRYAYALDNPATRTDPSGFCSQGACPEVLQATALCERAGWNNCNTITPDMASEILHGNAKEIDWSAPSGAMSDPVDAALFALSLVGGGGEANGLIRGFTKHGLNQAINRSIRPAAILDSVKQPLQVTTRIDKLGRAATEHIGREATVVLNEARQVITVHATHSKVVRKLLHLLGGD